jgi:hypothetical protein
MTQTETRPPQSLEEYFVGALEVNSGCAPHGEAVIPPPSECPQSVQNMYGFAQTHALTIIIVAVFALVLLEVVLLALNPRGGH